MHRNIRGYSTAFVIALAVNTLFFLGFQASFPVLPRFIADVVVNRPPQEVGGQVGLATTVTALVAVFTRIPTGQLADRFGRRRFMFVGAICFSLAPLIYMISRGMPILLLGRAVQGLGLATFTTAFQALVADLAPAERRGEALGLAGASVSIAFISAPLAGDWLANTLGYTPFFQISAATAAMSALLVILIPAPPAHRPHLAPAAATGAGEHSPTTLSGLRLALAQKGVRASVLTMAALGIPFGAFITFLPLFADEQQIPGAGVVFSVYAGTLLLAQPASGWLSDRLGRRGVILPGLAITSLATVVLSLDGSLWAFALAGIVFGLGGGLVRGGVDALVQDSVPPTLRGTAAAVQYTSFDFWIGLGSYPVGLLANAVGYAVTFVVTGVTCLSGGAGLAVMLRKEERASPVLDQPLSSRGD
jgi:MFS family permease